MTTHQKMVTVSRDSGISIEADGKKIVLSFEEFRSIEAAVNREIYYRADVEEAYGEIPSHVFILPEFEKQKYLDAVLDIYAELRETNDGDTEGLNWRECLDEAFGRVPIRNFAGKEGEQ